MTIVNPHLEGEIRTVILPLTSEVLLSDIALTNISEMLFNIIIHGIVSFTVVIILTSRPFPLDCWLAEFFPDHWYIKISALPMQV